MRNLLLASLVLLGCSSCRSSHVDGFQFDDPDLVNLEGADDEVRDEIRALGNAKYREDFEARLAYDIARDRLIERGPDIEPLLIDALSGSGDWGVRIGCIDVLSAIGSRRCMPALIDRLVDTHPLVSWRALFLLRSIADHRIIPADAAAMAESSNDLPPVPQPRNAFDSEEALDLWSEWQAVYGVRLQESWRSWWTENRHGIRHR